jgi:hypothetical protein
MDFRQERQMQSTIGAERAVRMARGALERVVDGKGAIVSVWDGALWITQEGDRRDYFVQAGNSFRVEHGGVTLIHALRRSIVTLEAPGGLRHRLARLWTNSYARYSNPTTAAL